jgi:Bacterial regulatory proteins, luxR family
MSSGSSTPYAKAQRVARCSTPKSSQVSSDAGADPLAVLTPREREVLQLMAEGRSNQGIAKRVVITFAGSGKARHRNPRQACLAPTPDDHRRVLAVLTFLGREAKAHAQMSHTTDLDGATLKAIRPLIDDAFAGEFAIRTGSLRWAAYMLSRGKATRLVGHASVTQRRLMYDGVRCVGGVPRWISSPAISPTMCSPSRRRSSCHGARLH